MTHAVEERVVGRMWLLKACLNCQGSLFYDVETSYWKCLACGREHVWTDDGVHIIIPTKPEKRRKRRDTARHGV